MTNVTTVWNAIYADFVANITDPAIDDRPSGNDRWIYGAFPDVSASDWTGFPVIIINVDTSQDKIVFKRTDIRKEIYIAELTVLSKSAQQLDSLTDSVITRCKTISTLHQPTIEPTSTSQVDFGGKVVHQRTILARWIEHA